jgi:ABC-2 type transport system ATP-binding protein
VKSYGRTAAVRGVDLTAEVGRITAILGPNGAGKTTTLECCVGLRRPDAGQVRILGLDPRHDSAALRARIGVMPQSGGVYSAARPREMARHVASLFAHPQDVDVMLERVGLDPGTRTPFRRMSGGEQQRLSLALALIGRPELVLLDEPTAGLDPHGRRLTWELIEQLRAGGVTVLLTTHHLDEAERLADDIVIIDRGEVVAAGRTPELLARGSGSSVRFSAAPHLDLTQLRAALPDAFTTVEIALGEYRVSGTPIDAHVLATLTAWCAAQDVMPDGLRVDQRTLEDLFLELTGRSTHERL